MILLWDAAIFNMQNMLTILHGHRTSPFLLSAASVQFVFFRKVARGREAHLESAEPLNFLYEDGLPGAAVPVHAFSKSAHKSGIPGASRLNGLVRNTF
jgi:hypothetical protein